MPEIDGAKLRELRRRKGFSLEGLAARSGMSERAIRDLESGATTQPRPNTVLYLAKALEVEPDHLWQGESFGLAQLDTRTPEAVIAVCDLKGEVMSRRTHYSRRILIGRDAERNDIHLPHHQVSLMHARVEVLVDALEVRDLGTPNGTFANGERIQASARVDFAEPIRIDPYLIEIHRPSDELLAPARTLRLRRS